MNLIVASTNPVKIKAATLGFQKVFPFKTVNVKGVSVDSGVSDQPKTDDETLTGATNRAKAAAKAYPEADFWIGLEGGLDKVAPSSEASAKEDESIFSFAWVVVKSATGQLGGSRTASFALPQSVVTKLNQGLELGDAMDELHHLKNSKQRQGAVGLLTNGLITRTDLYLPAVILALSQLKKY